MDKPEGCNAGYEQYEGKCIPKWKPTNPLGRLEIIKQEIRDLRDIEKHRDIYNEYDQTLDGLEKLTDMIKEELYGKKERSN
jgi:hypothetical protein